MIIQRARQAVDCRRLHGDRLVPQLIDIFIHPAFQNIRQFFQIICGVGHKLGGKGIVFQEFRQRRIHFIAHHCRNLFDGIIRHFLLLIAGSVAGGAEIVYQIVAFLIPGFCVNDFVDRQQGVIKFINLLQQYAALFAQRGQRIDLRFEFSLVNIIIFIRNENIEQRHNGKN